MERGVRSILHGDVMPVDEDILVHRVFSDRASRRQDVGVEDVTGFTSYLSLDRLSNAAARRLLESLRVRQRALSTGDDVDRLSTIVVNVEPGRRLLVVLLAIIKLGLAYVPVDSRSAVNRVKYILQVFTCSGGARNFLFRGCSPSSGKSPSVVQGRSYDTGLGKRSPPEPEAVCIPCLQFFEQLTS